MIDFVWHLRGAVPLHPLNTNAVVLDRVEQLLNKQQKSVEDRGPDYLTFNDPLRSNLVQRNGGAMVMYDHGRFWIEQGLEGRQLRYDLISFQGMVFCLVAAFVAFFFGLAEGGPIMGLKFAAGAFSWLYGMNILLALIRVPRCIRRAIADS